MREGGFLSEILIKTEGIVKEFPGVKALKGINFELKKGEVHALVGENGAGKSTFMKILSGAYSKDSGKVFFEGKEVDINSPKVAQELGISIIHQELTLCHHLTVAQNIFLGREFVKGQILDEKTQNQEAQRILDFLDIDIKPTQKVDELTVSKQQMVEIAKAISLNAKVIIMDEPTSTLSDREIIELFKVINELKSKGTSIIYISHRLEELSEIADRVSIMRDGAMVATKDFKDLTLDEIIRLMVGRQVSEKYPKVETPRGEKILEVKNLSEKNILKNISFELYKGEILGISGLVGSGRTELARAIFGADLVDSGEIILHGKRIHIKSPSDAIKNGIVYVPEDRRLNGLALGLSVASNIMLANIDKVSSKIGVINELKEIEICQKIVKDLQVKTPSLSQKVDNLSGGNQQKVIVGRWLVKQPEIFIFDEPTRGIDVGTKVEIYNILNRLKAEGIGIIVISSELPEILGISDRILVMCEGQLKANLETTKTNQEEIMYYATLYDEGRRVVNG